MLRLSVKKSTPGCDPGKGPGSNAGKNRQRSGPSLHCGSIKCGPRRGLGTYAEAGCRGGAGAWMGDRGRD